MILYRPVSLQELEPIYDGGMKAFPARLPQQPIFYPVLQLEYARQVAAQWNAKSGQSAGYVTEFKVEDAYIGQFEEHMVGGSQHQEFWIPADQVEEFNRHIVGHIKVVEAHFGNSFQGFVPEKYALQGKNAVEQFTILANSYLYKRMDFYLEIKRNHKAVFLNYPFWQVYEFKNPGLKEKIIQAIKEAWLTSFPKTPLPLPPPVYEEIPLIKPLEARAQHFAEAVREETSTIEETDTYSLMNPDEENTTFEEVEADSLEDLDDEDDDTTSEEEIDSDEDELVDLIEEDDTSVEGINSRIPANPVRKDDTFVEKPSSNSLVHPISEKPSFVKETATPFLVNPVREEITPLKQSASLLAQGIQLGLSGKYQEAVEQLSKAVERNPSHILARTSLGVAFHGLGEDDRALACYEAALRIDSKYAEAHYFRANILYKKGKVREAIAGYTAAIRLKPELIEAHQKPIPQDRLTDYSPTPAELPRLAKPAHRILDLNKSLEINPRQVNLFKQRAAEYDRLGNYDQAIADYNSALSLEPGDASTFHSRGLVYEHMEQGDRARKDFQQALAIDPQLSNSYIQRGVTFANMGNLRQSIVSFSEGIRLAPENPDAYFNRGTAYYQQGDLANAINDFSHVIRLSPEDAAAYYWRGICNEAAGRQKEAIADYQQFLAISQDPGAREEIEQRLSQWDAGLRQNVSIQVPNRNDIQNEDQVDSEKQHQKLDLYDVLTALEDRALRSTWLGSGVECYGEAADELRSLTDEDRPIDGRDFVRITSRIQQTVQGDFIAFNPGSSSHWILIRAWNGNGFYIELNDPVSRRRLRAQFPYLEEVEGASPSYEGWFLPI